MNQAYDTVEMESVNDMKNVMMEIPIITTDVPIPATSHDQL